MINVMTYDYHGDWETFVGHNAPLYPSHLDETEDQKLLNVVSYLIFTLKKTIFFKLRLPVFNTGLTWEPTLRKSTWASVPTVVPSPWPTHPTQSSTPLFMAPGNKDLTQKKLECWDTMRQVWYNLFYFNFHLIYYFDRFVLCMATGKLSGMMSRWYHTRLKVTNGLAMMTFSLFSRKLNLLINWVLVARWFGLWTLTTSLDCVGMENILFSRLSMTIWTNNTVPQTNKFFLKYKYILFFR